MVKDEWEGKEFLEIPGTVYITGKVHVPPEARDKLFTSLKDNGYELDAEGTYASLKDIHAAECRSCNSIISRFGVAAHNHKCESCNEPTMLDYVPDGFITFRFIRNHESVGNDMTFRILKYDDEKQELVLHARPVLKDETGYRRSIFGVRNEVEAQGVMEAASDLYRRTKSIGKDGAEIDTITIPHKAGGLITAESRINTVDIQGSIRSYNDIRVYQGKTYHIFDSLPVPESVSLVFEEAVKKKLDLSDPKAHEKIMSAAGQVSRVDYYHQDGRPAFGSIVYKRWEAFIRTQVDVEFAEWEHFVARAPRDGPGFINALAKWCAKMSDGKPRMVRDEPNMWNAINALGNALSGKTLGLQEVVAAEDGLQQFGEMLQSAAQHREDNVLKPAKFKGLKGGPDQG